MDQEHQLEDIKTRIKKFRAHNQWNKINSLITLENLTGIWFKVYQAEALLYLSRKEEGEILLEKVIKEADKNDPKQMFLLGKSYDILNQTENAFFWYEKAANQNEENAQNNLAFCFEHSCGAEKNLEKAFYWYERASNLGNPTAQKNLAICYQQGEGTHKNKELAVKWFTIASQNGDAQAKNSLAICYENGEGVEQNLEIAFKWYLESAEGGHDHGQHNVAIAYEEGDGVEKNDELSFYWCEKATKQNHPQSILRISRLLKEGIGCKIDFEKSYQYLLLASKSDQSDIAKYALEEIENYQKSSLCLSAHLDYHKMYKKIIENQSKIDQLFNLSFHFLEEK
eukprot:gene6882-11044_t